MTYEYLCKVGACNDGCEKGNINSPDCGCWHREGEGPIPQARRSAYTSLRWPAPDDAPSATPWPAIQATFAYGDRVEKRSGSQWRGTVVGWYSTVLTPEGYAVESMFEPGSVQIYPAKALVKAPAL